jgi:hypothetical protein
MAGSAPPNFHPVLAFFSCAVRLIVRAKASKIIKVFLIVQGFDSTS